MTRLLFILLLTLNLSAFSISSNDTYEVFETNKYQIIYTKDYQKEVNFIKNNLDDFIKTNDKSFGYSFDEKLRIVLISNNNQVANAFSTQVPYNMGVYFNGGSKMNDYFSSNSWLSTLFVHEMMHNYQINAKKSQISKTLHKYLGNNYMPLFAIAPFFTLPNLLLPTAFLEGNAVLNETLYGNGGRLYSGRFNALKNSLVLHNKITPQRFLNNHSSFPFLQEKYIVGGYYMLYLAQTYGLKKVNQFFYEHSIHSINPFLLNNTFLNHFHITFQQSLYNFIAFTKAKYQNYKELKKHNILASSYDEVYLSKINDKIYYITSDMLNSKILNTYNISSNVQTKKNTKLNNAKVFKINNKLYTSTASFISSTLYKNGLFDEDNYILQNTQGKAICDIKNKKTAYINIKESFLNTKLFIDDKFYTKIASSALFDESGNIYYFKQNNIKRALYKNKIKLFEFDGFYSKIVDIVNDEVYFISNTKNGSNLYKYSSKGLFLLNNSDNIINAKIINNKQALVVSVNDESYNISTINLVNKKINTIPTTYNIAFANKYKLNKSINKTPIKSNKYNELGQLQFSMLYPQYSYDSVNGSQYLIDGLFVDPVMFNTLNLYGYKEDDLEVGGINYQNQRYFISMDINLYNTKRQIKYSYDRGYGLNFKLYKELLKKGRHLIKLSAAKNLDDQNKNKDPLIITANHKYKERFALGKFNSLLSDLEIFLKKDRDDNIYGIDYKVNKLIKNEFYINGQLKSINSDVSTLNKQRGTKIVINKFNKRFDNTKVLIEGFDYNFYVKDINKVSLGFAKVLNYDHYFNFPISLANETIFYNYNYYEFTTYKKFEMNEKIAGITFDVLFAHKLSIPLTIKYIKNDLSRNNYKTVVSLGVEF